MRAWIECGVKDDQRGGWGWYQPKMTAPARAGRLWLVMAVATFAVVRAGGAARSGLETLEWAGVADLAPVRPRRSPPRLLSSCRHGVVRILAALLRGRRLPRGRLQPLAWPTAVPPRRAAAVPRVA
jgi:hypothetical protein